MLSATRQSAILARLRQAGEVSITELADELDVSPSTIRRDLDALSAEGLLRRVRGGGNAIEADPVPFDQVAAQSVPEREAIAAAAATLIKPGSIVLLDIGTTTAALARHLRHIRLTVITSSLAVVNELADAEPVEVVVLGGVLRRTYHSLVGALTERALTELRAHTCILSTSGVRPDGRVMDTTGIEVPVKRAMMNAADQVILLAGASKFPGVGASVVCGPEAIDTLVTNHSADNNTLAAYRAAGTKVVFA